MNTVNLPETDTAPPFSMVDYLLKTTLGAYFIPAFLPLILCGGWFVLLDFLVLTRTWTHSLLFAFMGIYAILLTFRYFFRWFKRFPNDVRQGLIPQNETLRLLPFWIPLFHILCAASVFYLDCHFENLLLETILALNSPFFFEWQTIGNGGMGLVGKHWAILFAPMPHCLVTFAVAVAATSYVSKNAPLPPPSKGLRRMKRITIFLCVITFLCFLFSPYT
jgi:hypothetical protein